MAKIVLNGKELEGVSIATQHTGVLLVKAKNGLLGCGYFSMAAAGKMQDRFAIVRGVSSIDEVLNAPVADFSPEAAKCGVTAGMKGRDALLLMENSAL